MGLKEDRKRWRRFHWQFDASAAKELAGYINKTEGDFTLRVIPGIDEKGRQTQHLQLFDKDGSPCSPAVNFSRPCPPNCEDEEADV